MKNDLLPNTTQSSYITLPPQVPILRETTIPVLVEQRRTKSPPPCFLSGSGNGAKPPSDQDTYSHAPRLIDWLIVGRGRGCKQRCYTFIKRLALSVFVWAVVEKRGRVGALVVFVGWVGRGFLWRVVMGLWKWRSVTERDDENRHDEKRHEKRHDVGGWSLEGGTRLDEGKLFIFMRSHYLAYQRLLV